MKLGCQCNYHKACLAYYSVLNLKALVGASNQEKTLIGAFSVIVKTDGSFAALVYTCILCLLPRAEQEQ